MAEGAGVTGIIMSSNTVDIYNPKTIRSTMGSLYRVPVIYVDDICEAADVCKSKGVTVYAAHLNGTDNYNKKDYTNPTALEFLHIHQPYLLASNSFNTSVFTLIFQSLS